MNYNIKNYNKKIKNENFQYYVMGIDIGGTNTNIGIAGVKKSKPIMLFSLNFKSKDLDTIIPAIKRAIIHSKKNFDIQIKFACIGAAGVVSPSKDYAQLTNVKWNVSSKEIIKKTNLKSVCILNDFETIGFGINLLNPNDNKKIYKIRPNIKENSIGLTKALIGAGTGFGKSILIYNKNYNSYIPIPSEGGHGDLPIHDISEMELVNFIKKLKGISHPINYEEVLSGRGIENIYLFLRNKNDFKETQYTNEIDIQYDKASLISKYKDFDDICKYTFKIFTRFYARCARNFVLDTLATGGLYIAGGIAAKNKEIFKSIDFNIEFDNSDKRKDLLKKVPINVILDYDISLYGACYAAMYRYNNSLQKNL